MTIYHSGMLPKSGKGEKYTIEGLKALYVVTLEDGISLQTWFQFAYTNSVILFTHTIKDTEPAKRLMQQIYLQDVMLCGCI